MAAQHRARPGDAELAADLAALRGLLESWGAETADVLRPVPLRQAVSLQLDLVLGTAALDPAEATE